MKRFILASAALAAAAAVLIFVVAPAAGSQYRLWRDAHSVREYRRAVGALDTLACGTLLAEAREYNAGLREIAMRDVFSEAEYAENEAAAGLDVNGSGVIAVLEIPKLGVTLPVYRDLSPAALARGAVHLDGTSLPVGGEGAHCVLAGQGGERFSSLFDGLNRLIPGDCFYLQTLQDTLTYEVEQTAASAPDALAPQPVDVDADLCTLMTATRRDGVDQRLLVRARRVGRRERPLDDDTQVLPGWAARVIFAAPAALAGLIVLALVEGLRRAVSRRRLKRMRL